MIIAKRGMLLADLAERNLDPFGDIDPGALGH
jgi:hypothetical protein